MAENILGLLFVTSSSRGRHVFRYPPDPKSPHTWLTQPIYSSDTYTATDTAVQRPKRKVFFDETDAKSSTASLRRMGRPWGDGSSVGTPAGGGGIAMSSGMPGRLLDYGSDTFGEEDGSDSDLSEDDYLDQARTNQSSSKDGGTTKETTAPSSPRVSLSVNKAETTAPAQDRGPDRFIESQYNSALNYSLDFLSDMLTPPRSAGNRKFEICVDELVFVGHPVFNNPDGKWGYPADPGEDVDTRVTGRGRRMREGGNPLAPVEEGKESTSPENHEPVPDTQQKKSDSVDRPPMLNMFHLVLILDKPDPKPWAQVNDGPPPLTPFDEVYREIAFKWTAVAFALQVQDGYIAREAWGMAKTREKAINDSELLSRYVSLGIADAV